MDEVKPTEVKPKSKAGNPRMYKGMPALNPTGRPVGTKNRWSGEALTILAGRSKELIQKVIEIALEDGHKEQGLMLKLCIERIIPQQKAIEVTGKDGKEISVRVVVDSVEKFNHSHVINGSTGELDDE